MKSARCAGGKEERFLENYFAEIFAAAAVVTVCSMLAYKGGRATKFALSVLLVYTVLTPLSAIIPSFGGLLSDGGLSDIGGFSKDYEEVAESAFCEGADKLICSELGLDSEGVRVVCRGFDYKNMRAERVSVILSGRCITADSLKIKRLVEEGGLGECEVQIEIG